MLTGIVAVVVALFVGYFSIVNGIEELLDRSGREGVVVVTRLNSNNVMFSSLDESIGKEILNWVQVGKEAGDPLITAEYAFVAPLDEKGHGDSVMIRGIEEPFLALYGDRFEISAGRSFSPGRRELIVGAALRREYPDLVVGSRVRLRGKTWDVVGVFEMNGDVRESEAWSSLEDVQAVLQFSGSVQSFRFMLGKGTSVEEVSSILEDRLSELVVLKPDVEFFRDQSRVIYRALQGLGFLIAGILWACGALGVSALWIDHIRRRSRITAIEQAVGFGAGPIAMAQIVECLFFGLIGSAVGCGLAFVAADGTVAAFGLGTAGLSYFTFETDLEIMIDATMLTAAISIGSGLLATDLVVQQDVGHELRSI